MKVGIMQPYFLPYIGYWQLMNAVDKYIILDDVNYIKRGWINRNRILLNGKDYMFTLPLVKADAFKCINENVLAAIPDNIVKTIDLAYRKAPRYAEVIDLLKNIFQCPERNLARFVGNSIVTIATALGFKTEFYYASEISHDPTLKAQDMILDIVKCVGGDVYYNTIAGEALYDKEKFRAAGVDLGFLKSTIVPYPQFKNEFIPGLSIVDVLMFNDNCHIQQQLKEYEIV